MTEVIIYTCMNTYISTELSIALGPRGKAYAVIFHSFNAYISSRVR